MISRDFAEAFAAEWIEAWNGHDLDRILSHYTDDFEFSSPFIASFAGEPTGLLKGREAVRTYWREALARRPDLHFELISVFAGASSVVIHYNRHDGRIGAEYLEFDAGGKVVRSAAHYAG